MPEQVLDTAGYRCLIVEAEGPAVRDAEGARRLIEEAMGEGARVIAVPVSRLDASFFQLRSGLAGEVLQKMVNYGLKLAVVGDVSAQVAASDAFRDLVVEAERGDSLFFVADVAALKKRVAALKMPQ